MWSHDDMKEQRTYIFVDDGYPESADFDTNYIEYDPEPEPDLQAPIRKWADSVWFSGDGHIGFKRRRHTPILGS